MIAPVSIVLITKDEEANIKRCLAGVGWASELIVVDTQSTDRTVAIAQAMGARIYTRDWSGYAEQKNFGIDQARQSWVFSLDADEVVPPALAEEITRTVEQPQYDAYRVYRPTYFMGRPLRHYGRARHEPGHVRLFRRGAARFNERLVNESVEFAGTVGTLKERLLHYSYPSVRSYWRKIHLYAALEARERLANGAPRGGRWFRAVGKLGWMLLWRRGLLDGPSAWIWIAGQAYQEWLATDGAARLRLQKVAPSKHRPNAV